MEVRENPDASRIRNSNSYSLHAQVAEAGAEPVMLGIARDNLADLREKIRLGLEHDIVLVSGGVSMGKYDFVEDVFSEFGVKVLFDSDRDETRQTHCVRPSWRYVCFRLAGKSGFDHGGVSHVRTATDPETAPGRRYPQSRISKRSWMFRHGEIPHARPSSRRWFGFEERYYRIRTAPWKGSSDLAGLSRANALVVIPQGEGMIEAENGSNFFQWNRNNQKRHAISEADARRFQGTIPHGRCHG